MKPIATSMKTFTVEGLSNKHCVLMYALLASYKMGSTNTYSSSALELIEMLEALDLDIDNNIGLVVSPEDYEGILTGPEIHEFVLELK